MRWWQWLFPEKHPWLLINKSKLVENLSLFPSKNIPKDNHWSILSFQRKELKQLMYIFKKRPEPILRQVFTELLYDKLIEELSDQNLFTNQKIYIVPIPKFNFWFKIKYNQTEILAKDLSLKLNANYSPILKKIKDTPKQAKLNRKDRLKNLQNAFKADKMTDKSGLYIIIDDISTTGSTIKEARRALARAGIKHIWSITIFD